MKILLVKLVTRVMHTARSIHWGTNGQESCAWHHKYWKDYDPAAPQFIWRWSQVRIYIRETTHERIRLPTEASHIAWLNLCSSVLATTGTGRRDASVPCSCSHWYFQMRRFWRSSHWLTRLKRSRKPKEITLRLSFHARIGAILPEESASPLRK